jgi:hypothetical protein
MGGGKSEKEKYEKKIDNHSFYNYMASAFDSSEGRPLECIRKGNALS